MIKRKYYSNPINFDIEVLEIEDLLKDAPYFRPFRASFNDIFGSLVKSYTRFHLYVYKMYPRGKRAFYLALWITRKFFELLRRDLIDNHHSFQFPHSKKRLCIYDYNLYRETKLYRIKTFGRDYRIGFLPYDRKVFCRLLVKEYRKMIANALKQPYNG